MKAEDREATLQEIANELGVSVERARQIEAAALVKLRASLIARGFDHEDIDELLRGEVGEYQAKGNHDNDTN